MQDGLLLGSVGFIAADSGPGPLPVEYFFGLDVEETCFLPRASVCEIVKLAVKDRVDFAVLRGLIAACTQYAFGDRGFGVGLAIVKPSLQKVIHRLAHVSSRTLVSDVLPERALAENPSYFFEQGYPRPICFEREDYPLYHRILRAQLDGKVSVNTHSFNHERDYSLPESYEQSVCDTNCVSVCA